MLVLSQGGLSQGGLSQGGLSQGGLSHASVLWVWLSHEAGTMW